MAPEKQKQQPQRRTPRRSSAWYALLLAPFVGMLWVPFYNRIEPKAGSIPFFYWYQFVWIGISAVLTAVVYFATRDDADR
jgi:FtsH-binding integral membrane protein